MAKDEITEQDLEDGEDMIEITPASPAEEVACCYNAICSVEDVDMELISEADQRRVREIKKYSLRIIHKHIKEMYEENFPKAE